jgi:hypothetical protein
MRATYILLIFLTLTCSGQILTTPSQKIVPVTDNSGLVMDIYKQTNAQSAQLAGDLLP